MIYKEYLAAKPLLKYIHYYGILQYEQKPSTPIVEKVPPMLGRGLIFCLSRDNSYSMNVTSSKGRTDLPLGYILPIWTESYIANYGGPFELIAVIFKPGKFRFFFEMPMVELVNRLYSFEEVGLKELEVLRERICEKKKVCDKIGLLNGFFLNKLKNFISKPGLTDYFLSHIPSLEMNNQGIVDLSKKISSYSPRHFRRIIRDDLGISPKVYQEIFRFNVSLNKLKNIQNQSLADIAYSSGFSDQSHFGRIFKKFTGLPPKKFLKSYHPFVDATYWKNEIEDPRELGY